MKDSYKEQAFMRLHPRVTIRDSHGWRAIFLIIVKIAITFTLSFSVFVSFGLSAFL